MAQAAQSVYHLFRNVVATRGSATAARRKIDGVWRDVTWQELSLQSMQITAGLVALGVQPRETVSIMSNSRVEWVAADLGILAACATTVPIYQSTIADDAEYILNDSGAVAVFVEDKKQLEKMRSIRSKISKVKKVICFAAADVDTNSDWEVSLAEFQKQGEAYLQQHENEIRKRAEDLRKDDVLTLIYTSGTTGKPKGAILTHDAMLFEAESIGSINLITNADVQLFFLPLAHVFAKVLEVIWLREGHVMAFAESIEKVVDNMGEVRPTMMCAVPRIFEKAYAKVVTDAVNQPGLKGKLAAWALSEGEKAAKLEKEGKNPSSLSWKIAHALVFKKRIAPRLHQRFGGNLRFFVSGGAPLSPEIAYFFKYNDIKICEGYGLTETSAATCVNLPSDIRIGTVGKPIPGMEVIIAGDGEILIRGRGVMKGYLNRPDATAEAIDQDGWFHTGDIGVKDKDGFVRITDRKKDIIVTAGGKNVAPQNIEGMLKTKSPLISQVVIHGDKRKFISAILTLDEANLKAWAQHNGVNGEYAQLTQRPEVRAAIEAAVSDLNRGMASYESIKKFSILDHDFVVGDQLTPSLKVKRKVCNEKYKNIFDGFYEGSGGAD